MEAQLNIFERLLRWIEESITIKLMSIGFLVLILLIPSSWIQDLMRERESRAEGVVTEVSSKWSGAQTLSGPILVVPYKTIQIIKHEKEPNEIVEVTKRYFFLPETLRVTGKVNPQILHRGIFDVAVYQSELDVSAKFNTPDFAVLHIADNMVMWKDAYMIFSINDLRGISDNPSFTVGGVAKDTEPSNDLGVLVGRPIAVANYESPTPVYATNGIIAKLGWASAADFNGDAQVSLKLKGSQSLNFVPSGKTTDVSLSGPWADPSFDGEFLPEHRTINEKGFSADWKVLHYNRPFSQQWTSENETLNGSEFGVNLLVPVDQYQKSIRTSKYGQLIIILTFVALFMVEITRKTRIHPFQYILVGVALIIYYTLLISLSEQVGYNLAYWIATLATVGLVAFYSTSFLVTKQLVMLFTSLLVIFYTFIFIIILQQDFSLLLGSVGLFLIVAALMYFSRKIEWYKTTQA